MKEEKSSIILKDVARLKIWTKYNKMKMELQALISKIPAFLHQDGTMVKKIHSGMNTVVHLYSWKSN